MDGFEPGTTLFRRYRLERLLIAHAASVAVWEATDLHYTRRVQLSLFEDGSTMLDHGRIDGGNFVVIDPPRAARLELAFDLDEDASFAFAMPRPMRVWRWVVAGVTCAVLAIGGVWIARDPGPSTSVTRLTSARIPVPPMPAPPPTEVQSAEPEHHDPPPKNPKPRPKSWDEESIRF